MQAVHNEVTYELSQVSVSVLLCQTKHGMPTYVLQA